jgi:two-component system phosphate regulon response regulator PhoB
MLNNMAKKRIIIVEDERDMAELVAMRLKQEHFEVEVAFDGREGLDHIRCNRPDLVLLDIMLPVMSGTDVLRELRNDPRTVGVPVIMLTARTEDVDVVVSFQLGADDYVTKPFSMSVLLARIAAVLRRAEGPRPGKGVLTVGPLQIHQEEHRVELDGQEVALTPTEFRLLVAIVAARGRVLSRNQLIDQVLGLDTMVSDRSIDVHLAGLRKKLGRAKDYIGTVRGVGYRLSSGGHEQT